MCIYCLHVLNCILWRSLLSPNRLKDPWPFGRRIRPVHFAFTEYDEKEDTDYDRCTIVLKWRVPSRLTLEFLHKCGVPSIRKLTFRQIETGSSGTPQFRQRIFLCPPSPVKCVLARASIRFNGTTHCRLYAGDMQWICILYDLAEIRTFPQEICMCVTLYPEWLIAPRSVTTIRIRKINRKSGNEAPRKRLEAARQWLELSRERLK